MGLHQVVPANAEERLAQLSGVEAPAMTADRIVLILILANFAVVFAWLTYALTRK